VLPPDTSDADDGEEPDSSAAEDGGGE
jgi:hypothetical protein